jgi:hypothetical protein
MDIMTETTIKGRWELEWSDMTQAFFHTEETK